MVETAADRLALLKDFGQRVQFKRGNSIYKTTIGILDTVPQLFADGDGVTVSTFGIELTVADVDVQQDDVVITGGKQYVVIDVPMTTDGMLTLPLQKA